MRQRDTIIISLTGESVRVGVLNGHDIVRADRRFVTIEDPAQVWERGLRVYDDTLRAALRDLKVAPGSGTHILAASETGMVDVFAAPSRGKQAHAAAELKLRQVLTPVPGGWQIGIVPTRETQPDGVSMLQIAEHDQRCQHLARLAERLGLRVLSVLPARGAMLWNALTATPIQTDASVVRVSMHEHAMTLTGWKNNTLTFARCTDSGYGLLVDALERSVRAYDNGEVSREAACRTLMSVGVPSRDQPIDLAPGLKGEHVLPLMQPAIQRCLVEIRQTLRFCIAEADLDRSRVVFEGPGAAVPGLLDLLAHQLERPLESQETRDGLLGIADDEVGDLAIAARSLAAPHLWMVPAVERARRLDESLARATRLGGVLVASALVLMAGNAYRSELAAKRELAPLSHSVSSVSEARKEQREAARSKDQALQIRAVLDAGLGESPDWPQLLSDVGDHGIEGVSLLDISCVSGVGMNAKPTMTVRGRALATGSASNDVAVRVARFFEQHPGIAGVRIVSNRIEAQGEAREFVIELSPKAQQLSPPAPAGESVANASDTQQREEQSP